MKKNYPKELFFFCQLTPSVTAFLSITFLRLFLDRNYYKNSRYRDRGMLLTEFSSLSLTRIKKVKL